ncbi:hypothetical protein [Paraburkholderia sp. SOS3]|uniref:hypothetical protein n=1 Tax=Paraburkholderia sp. SOS3 TaxID=1926494 RepID=UPI0009475371|nr:hypothetical protein [Paraburkholderia sp. SOS3]APR40002.1 hypothetical protein BTO02_33185 [Paraburkholderia sp. SOS3]
MESKSLEAWRNRPMKVTVMELCPRCEKLVEGVETRSFYGAFGQRFSAYCCQPCLVLVRNEALGH